MLETNFKLGQHQVAAVLVQIRCSKRHRKGLNRAITPMIAAFSGQAKPMRVSTAGSGGSDERMFTVISQGLQSGRQRQTGRTYFVSYSRLEETLRLITAGGGSWMSRREPTS